MHTLADGHDTPASTPECDVVWIDQAVPLKRSARIPSGESPTAVHAAADTHDTAYKVAALADGFGEAFTDHLLPLKRSTNVNVPDAVRYVPTATQSLADTHETP